jgi:dTDP-glucose 4,6-dehydratase
MKRVVITGGAGFLGSHLCDYFLDKNWKVVALDNFITGNPDNIAHLNNNADFEFIKHDVTEGIFISGKVDVVLHFASLASPADYAKYPIETLKDGAQGTNNCLGLAKKKKAKFMLASTSEVYGDPTVSPQAESYWGHVNPVGPRGCYDESKRYAEALTMAYHRVHGIDTRIVRIFNTFGPRMRLNDGRAVPNFINQALTNKPITIYGKGNQTRSFCYVSDLIEGIYLLLMSNENYPVNLGNPNEMSVKDFAYKIKKMCNSRSKIIFKPALEDDPKIRRPSIVKAKKILNWKPEINLDEGLKKTIDWFKNKEV